MPDVLPTVGLAVLALGILAVVRACHARWKKWDLDSGPSKYGRIEPR
jgi:hypothetical protein